MPASLDGINIHGLDLEILRPIVSGVASGRFPGFLFSRFPELFSDEGDAIYIDSDTVILRPLGPVFAGLMVDGLYAVEEKFQKYPMFYKLKNLKFRYYNAGVIAKKGCPIFDKDECVRHVRSSTHKTRYPDQDFFNSLYYKYIKPMNEVCNYINYNGRGPSSETIIYHMAHKKYL